MASKTARCVFLLFNVYFIIQAHPFKLLNCDKTSPVQLTVDRFPSPLLLKNNANLTLSAGVEVKQKIPEDLYVKISVAKKIGFWVRIPCIGCDFGVDCKKTPELCMVRDMCAGCSLNVTDITVKLPSNIEEKIPSFIPGFVLNGDYWAKIDVVEGTNKKNRVSCIEVYVNLKS
ncbi:uncharacterized protein LOC130635423 [Hydractinia symbiolongicarpus]|uniref:uncharacterized protein LOC130635423 n=1 Tax=Hydractinia symbiolongicarpus TaxID=13093 RepID=UPI00254EFB62|nr:uncharacterized protein LOC130635423 [Hydractinia symbiolongicarpus]